MRLSVGAVCRGGAGRGGIVATPSRGAHSTTSVNTLPWIILQAAPSLYFACLLAKLFCDAHAPSSHFFVLLRILFGEYGTCLWSGHCCSAGSFVLWRTVDSLTFLCVAKVVETRGMVQQEDSSSMMAAGLPPSPYFCPTGAPVQRPTWSARPPPNQEAVTAAHFAQLVCASNRLWSRACVPVCKMRGVTACRCGADCRSKLRRRRQGSSQGGRVRAYARRNPGSCQKPTDTDQQQPSPRKERAQQERTSKQGKQQLHPFCFCYQAAADTMRGATMCAVAFLSILQVCWPTRNCPQCPPASVHPIPGGSAFIEDRRQQLHRYSEQSFNHISLTAGLESAAPRHPGSRNGQTGQGGRGASRLAVPHTALS